MKKAKKLLSVFLAALMVMTTLGGVMMASAASQTDAEAAVAAYVKGEVTYPTKNGKEVADGFEKTLNGLLGAILSSKVTPETLYTDETANTILNAIFSVLKYSGSTIAKLINEPEYAEAKDYLNSLGSYEGVWADGKVDLSKLNWGITPGDREAFENVLLAATRQIGGLLLMFMPSSMGMGLYGSTVLPLLESLHVEALSADEYESTSMAALSGDLDVILAPIVSGLLDFVEAVLANPVDTLCMVLPDFANVFPGSVSGLQTLLSTLGVSIDLTDLAGLLNTLLADTGLTLPEIDLAYVASLGTAYVADSGTNGGYRMAIDGDKADVFMALMQYLGEMLKIEGNQNALIKLVGDQFGAGYGDEIVNIVSAARHGTALEIADASVALFESIADNLGVKADAEQNGILGFFAKVMDFFNRIARMIVDLFKSFGAKVSA